MCKILVSKSDPNEECEQLHNESHGVCVFVCVCLFS